MEASEPQRTLSRNSPNRCIPLSLKQLQLAGAVILLGEGINSCNVTHPLMLGLMLQN